MKKPSHLKNLASSGPTVGQFSSRAPEMSNVRCQEKTLLTRLIKAHINGEDINIRSGHSWSVLDNVRGRSESCIRALILAVAHQLPARVTAKYTAAEDTKETQAKSQNVECMSTLCIV
ncbi:hypothetical protein PoB_006863700 [Plakobranchus ocellatus]|uniref:Uncharacterized protein n=1 Tax=Plakobranchus ocellatus TaxID=259542 RepID=A0AAV4DD05_9GAST|nr:hypothetical protein PoB_006863700 [Plakobranchus ocellatus]